MSVSVVLSWPSPELWPNSRKHWTVKARATREARLEAKIVTLSALEHMSIMSPKFDPDRKHIHVDIVGHKPNARRRDLQNLQSALKAAVDGIADALKIDDEHFVLTTRWGEPIPPRGRVVVTLF